MKILVTLLLIRIKHFSPRPCILPVPTSTGNATLEVRARHRAIMLGVKVEISQLGSDIPVDSILEHTESQFRFDG